MNSKMKKNAGMSLGIVIVFIIMMTMVAVAMTYAGTTAFRNAQRLPRMDGDHFSAESAMNIAIPEARDGMFAVRETLSLSGSLTPAGIMIRDIRKYSVDAAMTVSLQSLISSFDDSALNSIKTNIENRISNDLNNTGTPRTAVIGSVTGFLEDAMTLPNPYAPQEGIYINPVDIRTTNMEEYFFFTDLADDTAPRYGFESPAYVNIMRETSSSNARVYFDVNVDAAYTPSYATEMSQVSTLKFTIRVTPFITFVSSAGEIELTEIIELQIESFEIEVNYQPFVPPQPIFDDDEWVPTPTNWFSQQNTVLYGGYGNGGYDENDNWVNGAAPPLEDGGTSGIELYDGALPPDIDEEFFMSIIPGATFFPNPPSDITPWPPVVPNPYDPVTERAQYDFFNQMMTTINTLYPTPESRQFGGMSSYGGMKDPLREAAYALLRIGTEMYWVNNTAPARTDLIPPSVPASGVGVSGNANQYSNMGFIPGTGPGTGWVTINGSVGDWINANPEVQYIDIGGNELQNNGLYSASGMISAPNLQAIYSSTNVVIENDLVFNGAPGGTVFRTGDFVIRGGNGRDIEMRNVEIQATGNVMINLGNNGSLTGNAIFVGYANQFTIGGSGRITIGDPDEAPQFYSTNHISLDASGDYHGVFVSRSNQIMNPPSNSTLTGLVVGNYHPPNVSGNPMVPNPDAILDGNALGMSNEFTEILSWLSGDPSMGGGGGGGGYYIPGEIIGYTDEIPESIGWEVFDDTAPLPDIYGVRVR